MMNYKNYIAIAVFIFLSIFAYVFIKQNANLNLTVSYPMFLKTRGNKTNVRSGPGLDYPVMWAIVKKDYPLNVTKEYDNWYFVEDISGARGWIYKNILTSTINMVIVNTDSVDLYKYRNNTSQVLAHVKRNNLLLLLKCDAKYKMCLVKIPNSKLQGWLTRQYLWGVY